MSDEHTRELRRRLADDPALRTALGMAQCRAGNHPAWGDVRDTLTEESVMEALRVQTPAGVREYRRWVCPRCGGFGEAYLVPHADNG